MPPDPAATQRRDLPPRQQRRRALWLSLLAALALAACQVPPGSESSGPYDHENHGYGGY